MFTNLTKLWFQLSINEYRKRKQQYSSDITSTDSNKTSPISKNDSTKFGSSSANYDNNFDSLDIASSLLPNKLADDKDTGKLYNHF